MREEERENTLTFFDHSTDAGRENKQSQQRSRRKKTINLPEVDDPGKSLHKAYYTYFATKNQGGMRG